MNFSFTTEPATFLERPNRFRVHVQLHDSGEIVVAHCPDPGRLRELLLPGVTVYVSKATNPKRKTAYDLRFVEHPEHGQLISMDTRLPNAIFWEGWQAGFFPPFQEYVTGKREVRLHFSEMNQADRDNVVSRVDFRLVDDHNRPCWVEVKSVTLVKDHCAMFPDAPTERGRRHVQELTKLARQGEQAAIVFIIQRPDADLFQPQAQIDPAFSQTLIDARDVGVALYAYTCILTLRSIELDREIPVMLSSKTDA